MEGIKTIEELETKLNVQTGDLIMFTFEPAFFPKGCIDIGFGLYNPYQGINGGSLGPSDVDLAHNAIQKTNLVKSTKYFRVHMVGHSYGEHKTKKMSNVDGTQNQIPVENVLEFRVVMKSAEVTKFYRDSLKA